MRMPDRATCLLCRFLLCFLTAHAFVLPALADSQAPVTGANDPAAKVLSSRTNKIEVVGAHFQITRPDGSIVSQAELAGATIALEDDRGNALRLYIADAEPDPTDPNHEVVLYTIYSQDPESGALRPVCRAGPDGMAKAFPLNGTWTPTGEHVPSATAFSLTCTAGVIGKCGYKPWKKAKDGTPLWKLHQACTRMARADYCGIGVSHTRNGTPINIFDRIGIQIADPDASTTFEAAWGPEGAICVRKVRIPEEYSIEELERTCPRLKGKVGKQCTEQRALQFDDAIIFDRS